MTGLCVGFWSPSLVFNDVDAVAERIKEICGPSSTGFPFVVSPVRDEKNQAVISYAVIRGHVPIHIDRPIAAEQCPSIFQCVLTTENRPVLLYARAGQVESECVLLPEPDKVSKMGLGAVELIPGRLLHFDICRAWHGITSFPTGDLMVELPEAVIIQVPWPRFDDPGGAIHTIERIMRRDERFNDLIRTGDEDEIRTTDD
jgi:hypothetical protein